MVAQLAAVATLLPPNLRTTHFDDAIGSGAPRLSLETNSNSDAFMATCGSGLSISAKKTREVNLAGSLAKSKPYWLAGTLAILTRGPLARHVF